MDKVKIYVPVENLMMDREIEIGGVIVRPSSHVQSVIDGFRSVAEKTRHTQEQKLEIIARQENDLRFHLGKFAFVEVPWEADVKGNVIPDDLTPVYDTVKTVLSVLYVMQKKAAGIYSIDDQKFGLKKDLGQSLSAVAAISGGDRVSLRLLRGGNTVDWRFTGKEIDRFETDHAYLYLSRLLVKKDRNDIERRVLASVVWLYDAALDYSPTSCFIKLSIFLEVLFASGKKFKRFRISRFSTLLDHSYVFPETNCLCPILGSCSHQDYVDGHKKLGLPGICSGYWNNYRWYDTRNSIVHDARRAIELKELRSFDWWSHKLFFAFIDAAIDSGASDIDDLEIFLEKKYEGILSARR